MWEIVEERETARVLDKLPPQVAHKYELWKAIVRHSGPAGLRNIKGFHDEKLVGRLAGMRSSRLSDQWRLLYTAEADTMTVRVERISPHDYRR